MFKRRPALEHSACSSQSTNDAAVAREESAEREERAGKKDEGGAAELTRGRNFVEEDDAEDLREDDAAVSERTDARGAIETVSFRHRDLREPTAQSSEHERRRRHRRRNDAATEADDDHDDGGATDEMQAHAFRALVRSEASQEEHRRARERGADDADADGVEPARTRVELRTREQRDAEETDDDGDDET